MLLDVFAMCKFLWVLRLGEEKNKSQGYEANIKQMYWWIFLYSDTIVQVCLKLSLSIYGVGADKSPS